MTFDYGRVRSTAEMLLAQRHLQADQQWRRQRCDDLLALLLGGSAVTILLLLCFLLFLHFGIR